MSTTVTTHQKKWWSGGKSPFNVEYGKVMMWYFLMSDAFTFGAFLISLGTVRFSLNYWPDPNVVFNAFPGAGHANLPLAFVSVMTFVLIISSVTMVLAVHAGHKNDKKGVIKWLTWTIIGGAIFLGCQAWEWAHLYFAEHPTYVFDHATNVGYIDLVGQATNINPWGPVVDHEVALAALQNTPQETLVKLVEQSGVANNGQLAALSSQELISQIDLAHLHIRETGPVAFGGFFFGITGFHGFHVFSGLIINIVMLIMAQKNVFEKRGHYLMIEKAGLYWHFVDLVWVFVFLAFYLI